MNSIFMKEETVVAVDKEFYDRDYFENGVTSDKSGYMGYEWGPEYPAYAIGLDTEFKLKGEKVVDIGCAKGFLVKALRELGVKAIGVEASDYAYECVETDLKKYILHSSAVDIPVDKLGTFKMVILYDILEHLDDEEVAKLMEIISNGLKPEYITMKSPFQVYSWDTDKSHINIKNEAGWIEVFSRWGYEPYECVAPKVPWTWWDNRTLCFKRK